ncbi:protein kinase domain-containing protein [Anatilimnocola floriformis]|uniref:protein kinase domain-containing protein n=1 Tax=Anatilimnocola floriformis TaxID=2948575 RepID=UPI0020C5A7CF|nr:protein kinase [Anatilimnocola floriformis]
MAATTSHPTAAALLAYGQGRLSPGEMSAIETHLAGCDSCCELLAATPDDTLMIRAREAATSGFRAHQKTVPSQPASPREIPQALKDHPRYRVLGLIGAGGMGAVYKAEHRKMERLVALKVINPAFVSSPAALERFEREVKTAAKLSHPNIVAAHDADAAGDLHFLVMEFVEGMSLDRFVASKGPLPPNVAANLICQAANGLQHAHEKGMIHRDIKPQNLMRTRDGSLKILDFGLARLASQALQSSPGVIEELPERPADATRAGSLLGTPDYIAPEQATDAHLADIRADIYSLGCTLYFLLTAEPPFIGGTMLDKLHAHKTCEPTPIRLRRPEIPEELIAVLERMMAKDPADRFARPADLAKALKPIANARPAATAPQNSEVKVAVAPSPTVADATTAPAAEEFSLDLVTTPSLSPSKTLPAPKKKTEDVSPWLWVGAAGTAVLMIATCAWLLLGNNGKQPIAKQNEVPKQEEQQQTKNETTPPKVTKKNQSSTKQSQGNNQKNVVPTPTSPKRVLMLLPQNELYYPDYINTRNNLPRSIQLVTAAEKKEPVGFLRFPGDATPDPITPDLALSDGVKAADYATIIFVGGKAPELCTGSAGRQVRRLLTEFQQQKKPITAICAGQHVPAFHGYFGADRRVAGGPHVNDHPDFARTQATRKGMGVEAEDNIRDRSRLITAATAFDGKDFAWKIAEAINAPYP